MLYALRQPIALLGLALAFVLALALRVVAIRTVQRRRTPVDLRREVDVFGAVAAVIGGTGWGKQVGSSELRPAPVRVLLAGPLSILVSSQLALIAYVVCGGNRVQLGWVSASNVLHGAAVGAPVSVFWHSLAVGLLCFGVLALVPLPPLDGWGLLRHAVRRPGPGFQKATYWLEEQNVGLAILLVGLMVPLISNVPLLLSMLDLVTAPLLALWSLSRSANRDAACLAR